MERAPELEVENRFKSSSVNLGKSECFWASVSSSVEWDGCVRWALRSLTVWTLLYSKCFVKFAWDSSFLDHIQGGLIMKTDIYIVFYILTDLNLMILWGIKGIIKPISKIRKVGLRDLKRFPCSYIVNCQRWELSPGLSPLQVKHSIP